QSYHVGIAGRRLHGHEAFSSKRSRPALWRGRETGGRRPCSSFLPQQNLTFSHQPPPLSKYKAAGGASSPSERRHLAGAVGQDEIGAGQRHIDRKSTRLNSSH